MTPSSWSRSNDKPQYHFAGSLLLVLLALPHVLTLQVVQGSNCTNSCLSTVTGYTTAGSDIACHDSDYNSTVSGDRFQKCISCEIQSEIFNRRTGQTNLGWALCKQNHHSHTNLEPALTSWMIPDNMRYALSWCLFEFPQPKNQTVSNTCTTTCAPISNALETNILTPNATTTYDYCRDPNFLPNVGACASCYKIIPNQLYMSNCMAIKLFFIYGTDRI